MTISQKSIKLLWSKAAGFCSFPDCPAERLAPEPFPDGQPFTLGEMAHIRGNQPGSNRYDATQTEAKRDDYLNLMLLCPTHHALIDRAENLATFPVEVLFQMKRAHEDAVVQKLTAREYSTKSEVARAVMPLLAQNRVAFENFGPLSDLARRNPHGGGALQSWVIEKAGTIVPNNRLIASIINSAVDKFTGPEQAVLAKFDAHVRSYERWVTGETNYEGVVRFPLEFEQLIKEAADAGI